MLRSRAASRISVSDEVFKPYPFEVFFGAPHVGKESKRLWDGSTEYELRSPHPPQQENEFCDHEPSLKTSKCIDKATSSDEAGTRHKDWHEAKSNDEEAIRRPLLFVVGSSGRGKNLYLREALRYFYEHTVKDEVDEDLLKIEPFFVSFSRQRPKCDADARMVEGTGGASIFLCIRLVFCALANLSDKPFNTVEQFLDCVENDLRHKRTSLAVIKTEVTCLNEDRSRGEHMVLFVDEVNKLGPYTGGAAVCASLRADAWELVRSEACRLTSFSARGSPTFSSIDQEVMEHDSSVSGRPCHAVGELQAVDPEKHVV